MIDCCFITSLKIKAKFFFGFIQPGSSIAICAGNISGSPFALRWMKVFRKTIVLQFRSVFPDDPIVQNILFISKLINIGFRLRYLIRDVNMLVVDNKVHASILYDAPIQIRDQEDLDNYHISWRDCRTLSFHGSERVTVYFMKVESRSLAEYMWATLDTEHSRGYAATRCWIPGKRKLFIRCPDTASCANCPHKEDKQPPVISWDHSGTAIFYTLKK